MISIAENIKKIAALAFLKKADVDLPKIINSIKAYLYGKAFKVPVRDQDLKLKHIEIGAQDEINNFKNAPNAAHLENLKTIYKNIDTLLKRVKEAESTDLNTKVAPLISVVEGVIKSIPDKFNEVEKKDKDKLSELMDSVERATKNFDGKFKALEKKSDELFPEIKGPEKVQPRLPVPTNEELIKRRKKLP